MLSTLITQVTIDLRVIKNHLRWPHQASPHTVSY